MGEVLNKCIWMWAGLLTYRLCDRDYECGDCPANAIFQPRTLSRPSLEETPASAPADLNIAPDRFQDPQHLWIRVLPASQVQIGLDPMAARLLWPAHDIELPKTGAYLRRGDPAVSVAVNGGTIRFASPVTGHVVRAHAVGKQRLRSMLRRPYRSAWLLIVSLSRLEQQLARYLFGRAAASHTAHEWARFQQWCVRLAASEMEAVPALPDGGEIDVDRLHRWAGSQYPALLGRWIGEHRFRSAKPPADSCEEGFGNPGGLLDPPEER